MTDQSTALERHTTEHPAAIVPLPPLNDAELASLYRTARALAESGLFKDATKAGQAFAKILAGRDLGLTPFEAMSALHVIEGKIEAGADLHATRVRSREGYDYRVAWIKQTPQPGKQPVREAVWADEEDPLDLREIVGCVIVFYDDVPDGGLPQDGHQRGVSRWTIEDSIRAGKNSGNHQKYPRNMYFSRAMTNGVAWFVPELMGGVRVYGLGEISEAEAGPSLTDGTVAGADVVAGSLPTAVEAVIARARELGHAGLANREVWARAISGQPEAHVETRVRAATAELNRLAAGKPEPVVEGEAEEVTPEAAETPLSADPAQTSEPTPGADTAPHAPAAPAEAAESSPPDPELVEAMRRRALSLLDDADAFDASGEAERATDARDEAEQLMAQVDAASDPRQDELGF
ncbi:MAG: hypothetical protein LC798_15505 [Chloroflexi bacterium]|nr:hypothetical protein [Chloroflexota bacterium]